MLARHDKTRLPSPEEALPGRQTPMPVPERHFVNGHALTPPFPAGMEQQYLAKNPGGYCGIGGTGVSCGTRLDRETP